ncbi:MAG: SDR family oxidoreductase [Candidatus Methanomethylicus sp.]|nr:SDR family oxidoreductase [Candidatus Methanomethylicus sp.]
MGKVFARALAKRGYAIGLHYYSSEEQAQATAEEFRQEGVEVLLFRTDLTSLSEVDELFKEIDESNLSISILVNSAGVMNRNRVANLDIAEWDKTMSLNLRAPFLLSKKAYSRMKESGLIVNISDAGRNKIWVNYPDYLISKYALEKLTQIMAKEFAPKVRVNAIAPGLFLPAKAYPITEWEKLVARTPLKRAVVESEIASALYFLIDNPSIIGQTIVVDGGYSLV